MTERDQALEAAAKFAGLLAGVMESGAGEPQPGARLRQVEREVRSWMSYPIEPIPPKSPRDFETEVSLLVVERDRWRENAERGAAIERRLRVERDEALRERDAERAKANEWLAQLIDAKKRIAAQDAAAVEALERVKHLEWLAAGSPMAGEHSGHTSDCAACREGAPAHPVGP